MGHARYYLGLALLLAGCATSGHRMGIEVPAAARCYLKTTDDGRQIAYCVCDEECWQK